MAHLRLIEEGEATGALQAEYEAAARRAGKVFNIVKAMSLNAPVLERSMQLYGVERELLAVVVSATNECRY
jgi:Asp/Glu/hydantoin racemase